MEPAAPVTTEPSAPRVTYWQAFPTWCRVAALSFGGPTAQIAVMHRILVDEKKWVGESRFLHALNFCMLLPGPEAQQLATYIGWLMHGPRGALTAGLLFIFPGFVAILALSILYVLYQQVPAVDAVFFGLKSAILAVVLQAVVRIGSRVPVFLPMRVTEEFCEMIAKYHPFWLNIHVNHPKEITPELAAACDRLTRAGVPLGNQSVLLAGVNDSVHIQRQLVHELVKIRVRPYYLYQCDLVKGAGHFRTSVSKGIEIIEGLRGHTSGYAVPTYVVDAPGGGGVESGGGGIATG